MTNYEKIKSMSVEELAEWLFLNLHEIDWAYGVDWVYGRYINYKIKIKWIKDWLKSEVEE